MTDSLPPRDCSPPASSVHGILQARILEWVVISFSRGSSQPRDQICISWIGRQILYHWATWEASILFTGCLFVFFLSCSTTFMLHLGIFQLWVGRIKKDEGSGLAMQSGDLFGLFKCPLWWRIQTLSLFQWEHIQVLQRHCQWPSVCKGITVMGNALTSWLYKPSSAFSNISSHSLLSGFCLER